MSKSNVSRGLSAFAITTLAWASAQAQSNVTLYGLVDASVGRIQNGAQHTTQVGSGIGSGSRLGFKGQEALGDGLNAQFVLEQGMALDTGALTQGGLSWGRQAYVGLARQDGWAVNLGRQYSPIDQSLVSVDPMGRQFLGNALGTGIGLHDSAGETASTGVFQSNSRVNNSVMLSQSQGATQGGLMFGAGNEDSRGAGRLWSGQLSHRWDGTMVTGALTRFRQFGTTLLTGAEPQWQQEWVLGATQDFGVFKAFVGHFDMLLSQDGKAAAASTASDPRLRRSTSQWLGVQVPWQGDTLYVNAMFTRMLYPNGQTGHARTLAVAYNHPLSKRTSVYGSYGWVANDERGLTPLYGAVPAFLPAKAGDDIRGLVFGLKTAF